MSYRYNAADARRARKTIDDYCDKPSRPSSPPNLDKRSSRSLGDEMADKMVLDSKRSNSSVQSQVRGIASNSSLMDGAPPRPVRKSRSRSPGPLQPDSSPKAAAKGLAKSILQETEDTVIKPNKSNTTPPARGGACVVSPRSFHGFADPEFYEPLKNEGEYSMELSPTTGQPVLSWWDRTHLKVPDEIVPDFLWLGAKRSAIIQSQMPFDCYTHCVFATNELTSPFPSRKYLCIKMSDDPDTDLRSRFQECNAFIEDARRSKDARVLVHCRMGQSRSTTLVVAYMMSHFKSSLKETLLWIKKHRDTICPNTGFFVQLQKYEKELFNNDFPSISIGAARKAGVCSVSKLKDKQGRVIE